MVKYGVPSPVACWAMAIGIPSRQVAIRIASAYRDEIPDIGYESFLTWLNTLSRDRLFYDFGLEGTLLEDVSRAIFTSSPNRVFGSYTGISNFLPCIVPVRGIKYENRVNHALGAKVGQSVDLVRDYDNTIDRNAIAVYAGRKQIGYIPREVAQVLASEIDTGTVLHAEITSIDKSSAIPNIKIKIYPA
jgi:hypothetical protein